MYSLGMLTASDLSFRKIGQLALWLQHIPHFWQSRSDVAVGDNGMLVQDMLMQVLYFSL
jgi:hypothetical protein